MVNGKKVNVSSYAVKKGDVVEVVEKSKQVNKILSAIQGVSKRTIPAWLEVDHSQFKGVVKDMPTREDISLPVEENMIVEYYSR